MSTDKQMKYEANERYDVSIQDIEVIHEEIEKHRYKVIVPYTKLVHGTVTYYIDAKSPEHALTVLDDPDGLVGHGGYEVTESEQFSGSFKEYWDEVVVEDVD